MCYGVALRVLIKKWQRKDFLLYNLQDKGGDGTNFSVNNDFYEYILRGS